MVTSFSTEEIQERKIKSERILREKIPGLVPPGEKMSRTTFFNLHYNNIPGELWDFLIWDNLSQQRYWDSLNAVNQLDQMKRLEYSENDLGRLTETLIQQTLQGKEVASGVPIFSDVFLKIGNQENPLSRFVTEEHRVDTVNAGFWYCLNATANSDNYDFLRTTPTSKQGYAAQEVQKLMDCPNFFDYFSFKRGIEKAEKIADDLNFGKLGNLNRFTRWYLIQEGEIRRQLPEKADEINGKLIAPVIYELYTENDYEKTKENQRLARYFIQGNIIHTPAVQRVLRRVFELNLHNGWLGYEYSSEKIQSIGKMLEDPEKIAGELWVQLMKETHSANRIKDVSGIDYDLREFVPHQVLESYIAELTNQVESIQTFNAGLFKKFCNDQDVRKYVPSSKYGKMRNNALEMYFGQKPRPKKDDLKILYSTVGKGGFGSQYMGDRVRGHVTMDFLRKAVWYDANNILLCYNIGGNFGSYGHATPRETHEFFASVGEYNQTHGTVTMNPKGLNTRICYPSYNKIPDFIRFLNNQGDFFRFVKD